MSKTNDPLHSTGIRKETAAPAASTAITGQTPPERSEPAATDVGLSPRTFTNRLFRFDMALLGLVLVLAFLLGAFAAHNSDIFLHLGLGSPFRAGGDASGWPHHAWLSSVLLGAVYEPFSADGEFGARLAIIAKALLIVGLAVVLVLVRRPGQAWLLPVVATALAVLV